MTAAGHQKTASQGSPPPAASDRTATAQHHEFLAKLPGLLRCGHATVNPMLQQAIALLQHHSKKSKCRNSPTCCVVAASLAILWQLQQCQKLVGLLCCGSNGNSDRFRGTFESPAHIRRAGAAAAGLEQQPAGPCHPRPSTKRPAPKVLQAVPKATACPECG